MTKKDLQRGWLEKVFAPAFEKSHKEEFTWEFEYLVEEMKTVNDDDPLLLKVLPGEPTYAYIKARKNWGLNVDNSAIHMIDTMACDIKEAILMFHYFRYYALKIGTSYLTARMISVAMKKIGGIPDEKAFRKLWALQKIDFKNDREYQRVGQLENENAFYNLFWL